LLGLNKQGNHRANIEVKVTNKKTGQVSIRNTRDILPETNTISYDTKLENEKLFKGSLNFTMAIKCDKFEKEDLKIEFRYERDCLSSYFCVRHPKLLAFELEFLQDFTKDEEDSAGTCMNTLRKENANRKLNVQWFCKGKSYEELFERSDLFKECKYFHKDPVSVDGTKFKMKRR